MKKPSRLLFALLIGIILYSNSRAHDSTVGLLDVVAVNLLMCFTAAALYGLQKLVVAIRSGHAKRWSESINNR